MTASPTNFLRRDQVAALQHLDLGCFDVGPGRRLIPISAWLITTVAGRRLLLDTGFPAAYAADERKAAAQDGLDSFGRLVNFGTQNTVLGALALLGLVASDISHVLLSHSHIDHIGGLALFPGAQVIMARAERTLPRPLYFGHDSTMEWPDAEFHLLDKTTEICGGLRMVATPGHTPGHMSFLVKTPGAAHVLAIDAINRHSEPSEGYPDAMDPGLAAQSGAHLMRLARRHAARLIPGHEPLPRPQP